jgi:hypothetical protein
VLGSSSAGVLFVGTGSLVRSASASRTYWIGAAKCVLFLWAGFWAVLVVYSLYRRDLDGLIGGATLSLGCLLLRLSLSLRVSDEAITIWNLWRKYRFPLEPQSRRPQAVFEDELLYFEVCGTERVRVWGYDKLRGNYSRSQCGKQRDTERLIAHLRRVGVEVEIDDKTRQFLDMPPNG